MSGRVVKCVFLFLSLECLGISWALESGWGGMFFSRREADENKTSESKYSTHTHTLRPSGLRVSLNYRTSLEELAAWCV